MTCSRLPLLALLLVVFATTGRVEAASDEEISNAIDKGIDYLLGEVEKNRSIRNDRYREGQMALETYALVVAGVSVTNPEIEKNFEALQKMSLGITYCISCYVFALDAAISQVHADMQFLKGRLMKDSPRIGKEYRKRLEASVNALVRIRQKDKGSWNYSAGGNAFDNSNTQFAVLGLGVGAKRKIPIDPAAWEQIARHFIDGQQDKGPEVKERIELLPPDERGEDKKDRVKLVDKDEEKKRKKDDERKKKDDDDEGKTVVVVKPVPEFGDEEIQVFARGWEYQRGGKKGKATWNMTCAGLSSLILAAESLKGKVAPDFQNEINKAIRDGYGWVMSHWNVGGGGGWAYYGIYSLEKVADLGEVKKFGSHDWYEEVANTVVKQQKPDGSWAGKNPADIRVNTSFALLVLNRATSLLTQRANRMVVTGPGAHQSDRSDRANWVYIQSMDRELHMPSVMRMARLRPSPQVLKFIELIVENFPPEKNGLLVPRLVSLLQSFENNKTVKKYVLGNLKDVTGVALETGEEYSKWYAKWKMADDCGEGMKKDSVPQLVKDYQAVGDSVPLRKKIIWALTRCRAREAAPYYVEDLSHADESIRAAAYSGLTVIPFPTPPPRFSPGGKSSERKKQLEQLLVWYESVK